MSAGPTIVVIEDDSSIRRMTELWLTTKGMDVTTFAEGESAIEHIRQSIPGAVILDLALPGLDGYDILKILRADPRTRDIPVIVVTAHADVESEVQVKTLGADEFVRKPFKPQSLIAVIERVMRPAA